MMEDPRSVSATIDIMFMNKSIERIGDHAENIAEHVVYLTAALICATDRWSRLRPICRIVSALSLAAFGLLFCGREMFHTHSKNNKQTGSL